MKRSLMLINANTQTAPDSPFIEIDDLLQQLQGHTSLRSVTTLGKGIAMP